MKAFIVFVFCYYDNDASLTTTNHEVDLPLLKIEITSCL